REFSSRGFIRVDSRDSRGGVWSDELAVIEQTLPAAFATEAALLVAAEGRSRIEFVVGIGPDDAGLQLDAHLEDARTLVRPHAGAEAVGGVVRLLDRLVDGAEGEDRKHRTEDFLARDPVAHRHVAEDRRLKIKALRRQLAGRLEDFRAFLHAALDEFGDRLELGLRIDRADVGVLVDRIADAE